MAITLNGSTGIVEANIADNAITTNKIANGTVSATDLAVGAARANFGAGAILQVVSTTKTDIFSTTSTSYVPVTGLSVNITPSSSSNKIMVLFTGYASNSNAGTRYIYLVRRGETGILRATGASNRADASAGGTTTSSPASGEILAMVVSGLDSPSTTSTITYRIDVASNDGGTTYLNRTYADQDVGSLFRTVSSLTVMEIAA